MIIYYGAPGLEAQVFQSYMASSGYRVQVLNSRESARSALKANPASIAVIAVDEPAAELVELASEMLSFTDHTGGHVFVLSNREGEHVEIPDVDVIPRPYRLSELVRRIKSISQRTPQA